MGNIVCTNSFGSFARGDQISDGPTIRGIAASINLANVVPIVSPILSDPNFAHRMLLVRGTPGFADLSNNALVPVIAAGASSVSAPSGQGWLNPSVFRFMQGAAHSIQYSKPAGFFAGVSDYTVEMFVNLDALTYDASSYSDGFRSFFRATLAGVKQVEFSFGSYSVGDQSVRQVVFATPGANGSSPLLQLGQRTHLAFVVSGTDNAAYVNGVRVLHFTSGSSQHNFDLITLGYSTAIQGYIEEVRVSDFADYSGASFTPPTYLAPNY